MRSRAARLIFGALILLATGGAAYFLLLSDRQIRDSRAALRTFDLRAREATDVLSDLRAAEQAYVANGQGIEFWMPKVATTMESASEKIAGLRASATNVESRLALDQAASAIGEFANVDQRARDYIKSGQPLMAADVVFAEGSQMAMTAARQVEAARLAEHQGVDAGEALRRRQQALALGGTAALTVLVVLLLIPLPRQAEAEPSVEGTATGGELMLRDATILRSPYVTARPEGPILKAAAEVCTDFGRVTDIEDLKNLLRKSAEVMDASGLVVWLGAPGGAELRPELAHGYAPEVVARMPTVPRMANNAAAAAFRTSQLQIVLARPGTSNGAVVAPILSSTGCIGALSAEIRGGGEASDGVQALAAIFAAQLANVLATESSQTTANHNSHAENPKSQVV